MNNCDILYTNKSLFSPDWVNNNVVLVTQLINVYWTLKLEFLNRNKISVGP